MDTLTFQIISTDRAVSCRWQKAFQREGWPVTVEVSCREGRALGKNPGLDLIELGIPDCKNHEDLRAVLTERQPVSALVFGDSGSVSNRQIAALLEAGADDFIYKDLDERVLVAKLKAHKRRLLPAIEKAASRLVSNSGDLRIDRNRRAVTIEPKPGKSTEICDLTQKEFEILSILVSHERSVLTRDTILERVWGNCADQVYSECIDKHVESLRRKLGLFGKRIKTVYGSGYMFTTETKQ